MSHTEPADRDVWVAEWIKAGRLRQTWAVQAVDGRPPRVVHFKELAPEPFQPKDPQSPVKVWDIKLRLTAYAHGTEHAIYCQTDEDYWALRGVAYPSGN